MVKLLWMMEEAGGTALPTNGGVVTLVLHWCLTSLGLMSNDHRITDGLCCTLPVGQGRLMAIVEKQGCSKDNAVWVHQCWQTQKEEKKTVALDCWR